VLIAKGFVSLLVINAALSMERGKVDFYERIFTNFWPFDKTYMGFLSIWDI
jgi:hypothetical protein